MLSVLNKITAFDERPGGVMDLAEALAMLLAFIQGLL